METHNGPTNVRSYARKLEEFTTSGDTFTLRDYTVLLEAASLDHRMADDPG
jgi:hypothetical protein